MATFKAEVYAHHAKNDATYNVKIRITHKSKKKYPATNIFLTKDDITRSMKIKNQQILDAVLDIERACRQRCNEYQHRLGSMDVEQIAELVSDIINGEKKKEEGMDFDLDFIAFSRDYINKIKGNGNETYRVYEVALNSLIRFTGRDTLSIHEITKKFVNEWITWIQEQPAPDKRKKGTRAPSLYPAMIKALHNRVKDAYNDEDMGIIRIPFSPFKKADIPKYKAPRKRAITAEDIRKIAALTYEKESTRASRLNFAKDMFLLSFGLIGINEADLYYCDHYKDGRITYNRKKTKNQRDDNARISIKVAPEIAPLIEKYRDTDGKRVFCFYKTYKTVGTFTAAINGLQTATANYGLKKIGAIIGIDDLEFYAARHSWGTIARNKCGISKDDIHLCLNHATSKQMKVTDMYIEEDFSIIDTANRKVLDYGFWKKST
jgi:integrase